MKILHIHQDYPDGLPRPFTRAVASLIEHSWKLDCRVEHFVLSINRTSNPFKVRFKSFEQGMSVVYWSLPIPILFRCSVFLWSWILSKALRQGEFDVIHGHKLTSEGVFAHYLSRSLSLPYYISIRGGSDLRNIERLPDCHKLFRDIYSNARAVFMVSPWAKANIEKKLNAYRRDTISFPNICEFRLDSRTTVRNRKRYTIVLSFHQYIRKGIIPTLEAIAELKKQGISIELDIVGGGNHDIREVIEGKIIALGLNDSVNILGKLEHFKLINLLQGSRGLVLPALNETFGMAYIEALACGAPVIYMKGTGIDGFFEGKEIGVGLRSQSSAHIQQALQKIENNYEYYSNNVSLLADSGYINRFEGKSVSSLYLSTVTDENYV